MYDFLNPFVESTLPRIPRVGHAHPQLERNEYEYGEWGGGGQLRVQVGRVGAVSQVEVNQDLDAKMHGLCVHFVTTARGGVLKIVLELLCLGSRYRLFESNGRAGRVVAAPNVLVPILTRILWCLPHCIVHY